MALPGRSTTVQVPLPQQPPFRFHPLPWIFFSPRGFPFLPFPIVVAMPAITSCRRFPSLFPRLPEMYFSHSSLTLSVFFLPWSTYATTCPFKGNVMSSSVSPRPFGTYEFLSSSAPPYQGPSSTPSTSPPAEFPQVAHHRLFWG